MHIRQLHGLVKLQSYDTQMKPVGILAQPVTGVLLPSLFFELTGIQFLMSTSEVIFLQHVFGLEVFRVWKTVPSPLALRPEGNAFFIVFRESLQAGDVDGIGKFAVAHGEGRQGVGGCYMRIVPGD